MTAAIYIVGPGRHIDLQYSMRSLRANCKWVGDIWVAGHQPGWLRPGPTILYRPQHAGKWRNGWDNLRALLEHPKMPDDLLFMNDDFYVMAPTTREELAGINRGRSTDVCPPDKPTAWREMVRLTRDLTADLLEMDPDDVICHDLHAPMPIERDVMLDVLDRCEADYFPGLQFRTVYGNLATQLLGRPPGVPTRDFKLGRIDRVWQPRDTGPQLLSIGDTLGGSKAWRTIRRAGWPATEYEIRGR